MDRATSDSTREHRSEVRPRLGIASQQPGTHTRFDGGDASLGPRTREILDYVEWVAVDTVPGNSSEAHPPKHPLGSPQASGEVEHPDTLVDDAELDRPSLDGYVLVAPSLSQGHGLPNTTGSTDTDRRARPPLELPVEDQDNLDDTERREHFVERVFAHARLRTLFEKNWSQRDLMSFQARHKMQLMAHSVEGARRLGRIAARAGTEPAATTRAGYTSEFGRALCTPITRGGHTNALQHLFGMVSDRLDDTRRHEVLDAIERHRHGAAPLDVPVALVRQHCAAESELSWAAEQTYLTPYPPALRAPAQRSG